MRPVVKLCDTQQLTCPPAPAFAWIDAQFAAQGLLPSSRFTKALAYACERREGLLLYLDDPDLDIDTNSLERALRAIPMGHKKTGISAGSRSVHGKSASSKACW